MSSSIGNTGTNMMPKNFDTVANIVVIIILVTLSAILFIVWFIYGPNFFTPYNMDDYVIVPVTTVKN